MDGPDPRGEETHARAAVTPAERRASRVARWWAIGSTLLVGVYLVVMMRPLAPAWRATGRIVAALTIAHLVLSHLSNREEGRTRMAEMKLSAISRQLSVLLFLLVGPLAGQTSLSIYSDGRVVVRRSLPQAAREGEKCADAGAR